MKVEKINVQCNRYVGCCMKQWIKIPKATQRSPNLRKRLTCQTSFSNTSLMKDDVNDEMPNGTPKDLNSFSWGVKLGWGVKVKQ
jgi:hypothetical protein